MKQPDKIKAQLIARKAIRIAEAYARNANNIMKKAPAISQKDLKVVDLENKKSKVFLCTHNSLPVDCCTCCKEMSTHCCQFCKAEKAEQKEEKAILTGVDDNTDSSENTKESAVRDDSALKVGKTRKSKEASGHSSGPPKLVKTPRKIEGKPISKGVRSPKSKVPAFMKPKVSSNTRPHLYNFVLLPHNCVFRNKCSAYEISNYC